MSLGLGVEQDGLIVLNLFFGQAHPGLRAARARKVNCSTNSEGLLINEHMTPGENLNSLN